MSKPKDTAETPPSDAQGVRLDVAAWGLALAAGCRAVEIFLEAQSMAGAVGQAVLVEWGSSRLGVAWSDPAEPTTAAAIARRALVGAAIGLGVAGLVFATLAATRGVTLGPAVSRVEASVLVLGFATAGLHAWRDELLLHGITLRALGARSVPDVARVVACGVTSAGAALGRSDATARTVFVALLLGVLFGALWIRDRGAWQPWAAHAAFRWTTGTLLSGGLVHAELADDAWAGGSTGWIGGTAAAVALLPVSLGALAWIARRLSPRSAGVG
ncbi:MAG: hypothetical protein KIS78_07150 [Labilithrix sp.]|nr:hypothetical protein [Labilithrix sp.]MCW5832208.1 hypothetical protein [Labilithrix sp.]